MEKEKLVRNDSKGQGSKTISREKGDKIIEVLKKDPSAEPKIIGFEISFSDFLCPWAK